MWHRATIKSHKKLSPTVTGLTLKLDKSNNTTNSSSSFTFSPGQWVDFQPSSSSWKPNQDGSKTIGGYSITSIPSSLPYLELAIQSSHHPVAEWITLYAKVDDCVNLRVGGSFTYTTTTTSSSSGRSTDDETTKKQRILFVAGGVGINPLFSMIRQWYCYNIDQTTTECIDKTTTTTTTTTTTQQQSKRKAVLIYSAKRKEDLLFVSVLNDMMGDNFRVVLTTTTTTETAPSGIAALSRNKNDSFGNNDLKGNHNIEVKKGRIDHDMIQDAVCWMNTPNDDDDEQTLKDDDEDDDDGDDMIVDLVYICGPPGMPEDIQRILIPSQPNMGKRFVRSVDDVHYEKWW